MRFALIVGMAVSMMMLGCKKEEAAKPTPPPEAPKKQDAVKPAEAAPAAEAKPAEAKPAEAAAAPAAAGDVLEVTIVASDAMQYDKLEISAKAGQKIKLTLKHGGTLAKNVMGHNFVLLKAGTDLAKFTAAAATSAATDYIPADKSDIIANTGLVGGGESTTIEFTAPAAGTYDYICSYPGHYAVMKGKLKVS
ncbi:MAG: azurin [Myxococcaceae bacterium]|jgi:azurin|nr:azurin [Myxococcaceae bacterium]